MVDIKSEEIKRVALAKEHCWSDLIEGNPQSRRRDENTSNKRIGGVFCKKHGMQRTITSCALMWSPQRGPEEGSCGRSLPVVEESVSTIPAEIITDVNIKLFPKQ